LICEFLTKCQRLGFLLSLICAMKTKGNSKKWKLVPGIYLFLMTIIAGIAFGVFYPKLENTQITEIRFPDISLIGFISDILNLINMEF
jgi:hypothetical protein